MKKIDPILLKNVSLLSSANHTTECVVYAYNYHVAKKFLYKIIDHNKLIEYPFIKAFGLKVDQKNIFKIAKIDAVKYVSSALKVSALNYESNNFLDTYNRYIPNTNNISVAVIDTGVSPHLDLMIPKRIIKFVDMVNNKNSIYDDNGHGTFVTGILCGNGTVSNSKYQGIDNNINIIAIKALDNNGETGTLNILNSMQWIYENCKRYNIKVVCMSFGSMPIGASDPLIKGAEVLWDNGIVVVCAGGNSGPSSETIKAPGASSKVITVGALDIRKMQVAEFSSRGPIFNYYKPDLIAPGVDVIGLNNNISNKNYYTMMSGTSVATPMVAGVCSMILKMNPRLTPNQVKSKLISCCTPITGDRNIEGFGYLDGFKLW